MRNKIATYPKIGFVFKISKDSVVDIFMIFPFKKFSTKVNVHKHIFTFLCTVWWKQTIFWKLFEVICYFFVFLWLMTSFMTYNVFCNQGFAHLHVFWNIHVYQKRTFQLVQIANGDRWKYHLLKKCNTQNISLNYDKKAVHKSNITYVLGLKSYLHPKALRMN